MFEGSLSSDVEDKITGIAAEAAVLVGRDFLREICRLLAQALGVKSVLINEIDPADSGRVRVVSFWSGADFIEHYSDGLAQSPCAQVIGQKPFSQAKGIRKNFPTNELLQEQQAEGYVAVPLFSEGDVALGALVALHDQAIGDTDEVLKTLLAFAPRVQAEIDNLHLATKSREILEGTNVGYWEWSIRTGVLEVNERWAEIVGKTRADLEPTTIETWRDLIHPDDLPNVEKQIKQYLKGKKETYDAIYRQSHAAGGWVWVNARGKVIERDSDGNPTLMSGIHLDITMMKNMEEDLRRALVDAEQANQAKSEFLASMSHELRTPLNAVLGFAEMLLYDPKTALTPSQAESVDHIMEGGKHLLSLINEVLDLSRIEADKIILSLDEVEVEHLVADCVALVSPIVKERNLKIVRHRSESNLAHLRTDRVRLKQILLNLLSNAVNYNNDGGSIDVRIESGRKGFIKISVQDTGIGIAEKDRHTVFNMFHRLGADPMLTRKGTGIGLTVSKMLVERMAGRIGFESKVGKGSTFWVEIPAVDNLETLIWTDSLLIDVPEIDADHKHLAALVNRFGQMTVEDDDVDKIIERLVDYAGYHFQREEAIMEACEFPDFEKHKTNHNALRQELLGLVKAWNRAPSEAVLSEMRKMLCSWLFNHIIHDDVSIAPHVRGHEKAIAARLKLLESQEVIQEFDAVPTILVTWNEKAIHKFGTRL